MGFNKVITDEQIIKETTSIFKEEKCSELKHETPFGEITIVFKEGWCNQPDIF